MMNGCILAVCLWILIAYLCIVFWKALVGNKR